jgi:hypothetical protein
MQGSDSLGTYTQTELAFSAANGFAASVIFKAYMDGSAVEFGK